MNLLSRRSVLAIAAVVDVALHSRSAPVAAKALAARHKLPSRHLETLLQGLVHAKILKGVRGPRGGYELARERRRITVGEIVHTAVCLAPQILKILAQIRCPSSGSSIRPSAGRAKPFSANLDAITVKQIAKQPRRRMCSPTRRSAAISLSSGATFERGTPANAWPIGAGPQGSSKGP